ncbi:hypothetical protein Sjap_025883 [Stephania japonica]|uniref:Uncharacterized protein n=1 Tax=Stephania japonica TaxID=461633 RepID=A0AAP0E6Y2_9MAGN
MAGVSKKPRIGILVWMLRGMSWSLMPYGVDHGAQGSKPDRDLLVICPTTQTRESTLRVSTQRELGVILSWMSLRIAIFRFQIAMTDQTEPSDDSGATGLRVISVEDFQALAQRVAIQDKMLEEILRILRMLVVSTLFTSGVPTIRRWTHR